MPARRKRTTRLSSAGATKRPRTTQSHTVNESGGLSNSPPPPPPLVGKAKVVKAAWAEQEQQQQLLGASPSPRLSTLLHTHTITTTGTDNNDTSYAVQSEAAALLGSTPNTRTTRKQPPRVDTTTTTTTTSITTAEKEGQDRMVVKDTRTRKDDGTENEECEVWISEAMIDNEQAEEKDQAISSRVMQTPQHNHDIVRTTRDPLLQEEEERAMPVMSITPEQYNKHNKYNNTTAKRSDEETTKDSAEPRLSTSSRRSGRRSDSAWLARLPATVTKSQLAQNTSAARTPDTANAIHEDNIDKEEDEDEKARRIVLSHDAAVQAILHEEPATTTRPVELRPGCALPSPRTPLFASLNAEAEESEEAEEDRDREAHRDNGEDEEGENIHTSQPTHNHVSMNHNNNNNNDDDGYDLFDEEHTRGGQRVRLLGATPRSSLCLPAGRSMNLLDDEDNVNNEEEEDEEEVVESVRLRRNQTHEGSMHIPPSEYHRRAAAMQDSDTLPSPHPTQSQNVGEHETTLHAGFSLTQEAMRQSTAALAAPLQRRGRQQRTDASASHEHIQTGKAVTDAAAKLLAGTAQVIRRAAQSNSSANKKGREEEEEELAGLTGSTPASNKHSTRRASGDERSGARDASRTPSAALSHIHPVNTTSTNNNTSDDASQAARHAALLWARKTRQFFDFIDKRPLKAVSPGVKKSTATKLKAAASPGTRSSTRASVPPQPQQQQQQQNVRKSTTPTRVQPVMQSAAGATSFAAMVSRVKEEARRQQAERLQRTNV